MQITFDDKEILNHPKTTSEIVECCKDIKVLGRKELRMIITWHKQMREWKKTCEKSVNIYYYA